jgi:ubiquinone/menaquinone biosynthesis C-methylase UbiE
MKEKGVTLQKVKRFWEKHPLLSTSIPHPLGSKEFLEAFDCERERIEPLSVQRKVYNFKSGQNKTILDVGCGNGWVLSHFFHEGARCFGVDLTQRAIDISKKRFVLMQGSAFFMVANAEELPFKDSSFDIVTAMGVLHHTPNIDKAIGEIDRVLKPRGRIVLMLYHKNSILYRFYMPLRLLYQVIRERRFSISIQDLVNRVDGEDNPLGRVYSRHEVRKMLSNFEQIKTMTHLVEAYEIPLIGHVVGKRGREILSIHFGWFLYSWGIKKII